MHMGHVIEIEAGGEQSTVADDELVAVDLSLRFSFGKDSSIISN